MIWRLKKINSKISHTLASELNFPLELASFLVSRGFTDAQQVLDFKNLDLKNLPKPSEFVGMKEACTRLIQALKNDELVAIYGDYDVDGLTSSALLYKVLTGLGHRVIIRIPNRLDEGYGFKKAIVKEMLEKEVKLLITVDCGISDHEAVKCAQKEGLDVIITDHHRLPAKLPEAVAIINPHQANNNQEKFDYLSGVGVAFFLANYLRGSYEKEGLIQKDNLPPLAKHLALVALGTVADVSPMVGINRILVQSGLSHLADPISQGLQALKKSAGIDIGAPLTPKDIGFKLAPRLNAAGRLSSPKPALDLLISNNLEEAYLKAEELDSLNKKRYDLQDKTINEALEKAEQEVSSGDFSIALASENWSKGIVGLAASRLSEKYKLPTVLFSVENGLAVGSGRSRPGFNLYESLNSFKNMFLAFGGHSQAAGLTIKQSDLLFFKKSFEESAAQQGFFEEEVLHVDFACDLKTLLSLENDLAGLGPYGADNEEPLVIVRDLKVLRVQALGRGNRHLKLTVSDEKRKRSTRIFWGFNLATRHAEIGPHIDIVCRFDISEYRGSLNTNWHLIDFKTHRSR